MRLRCYTQAADGAKFTPLHSAWKGPAVRDVQGRRPFGAGGVAARQQRNQRVSLGKRRLQMRPLRGRQRVIAGVDGLSGVVEEPARRVSSGGVIAVPRHQRGAREIHFKIRHLQLLLESISFSLRLDEADPGWNQPDQQTSEKPNAIRPDLSGSWVCRCESGASGGLLHVVSSRGGTDEVFRHAVTSQALDAARAIGVLAATD